MKPLRIYLKNFMNHRKSEIDCTQFQSALIVGKAKYDDEVSNGVGKTSVLSGIEYALFNKSHKTNLDEVVRIGKKKCTVEFDFELGGNQYRIYRHRTIRGSADLRLFQLVGKKWESISERTPSETEKKLRDLLKITHKAFEDSVLFRQDDITGLSTEDPKKRKEILKEPLNLIRYTKLEDIAKKRATPIRKSITQAEASIKMLGDPDGDIAEAQDRLEGCAKEVEHNEAELKKAQSDLKARRKRAEEVKDLISSSSGSELERKLREQSDRCVQLGRKVKAAKEALVRAQQELQQKHAKYNSGIVSMQDAQRELDEVRQLRKKYPEDEVALSDDLEQVTQDERKGENMIAKAEFELEAAQESIPDEDKCPKCKQDISPEYRQEFQTEAEQSIKTKKEFIGQCRVALGRCRKKKERLQTDQNAIIELRLKENTLKAGVTALENNQVTLEDARTAAKKLVAEREHEQEAVIAEHQQAEESLEQVKLATDKSKIADLSHKLEALNRGIAENEADIDAIQRRINQKKADQGGLKERIRSRTEDKDKLDKLQVELDGYQRNLRLHQKVAEAFSHKGIPTFIIHTILNELQLETNKALKELRPDLEIQLDADLNITYMRNGKERQYGQLSHGQCVYIALSFKRGLARVIQKKLGVDIRMLQFDEVDSPLDKAGVKAFADAVHQWQNEFTIFVITHNDALKDRFSHAILVEENDTGAEASLVTSW